jgi:RNA-binding protein
MLTSKQRAYLRSRANALQPITQIGKDGISRAVLEQIDGAVKARELIKLHVLPNSGYTARQACDIICGELKAEPVQVIGGMLVIFRKKEKDSAYNI